MQVHCVRSNATQGNTSIYFKQASDLTKEFVKFYKNARTKHDHLEDLEMKSVNSCYSRSNH